CVVRPSAPAPLPRVSASIMSPSLMVMIAGGSEVIGWPLLKLDAETDAVLGSVTLQVLKLPSTKSDSVAVGLCGQRVSARNVEKQPFRPRAVRLMPSSRNSPAAGWVCLLLLVYNHGTLIGPLLTMAKVLPLIGLPLLRATRLPVASSPTHFQTLMVEV